MLPDLGSLTSLTGGGALHGGAAGPSSATSSSTANQGGSSFKAPEYNFGSNNGIPTWLIVAALVAAGVYVYKSK